MNEEMSQATIDAPTNGSGEGEGLGLAHFIGVLSEARWLVGAIAAASFVIATVYAFLAAPVYQADTVLHVLTQQSGGLSGLEQLATLFQGSAVPTETEIELLKTRAVLTPVIEKLNLNIRLQRSNWFPSFLTNIGTSCREPGKVSVFQIPREFEGQAFELEPAAGGTYTLSAPDGTRLLTGTVGIVRSQIVNTRSGPELLRVKVDAIAACVGTLSLTRLPTNAVITDILQKSKVQELGQQTGIISVSYRDTDPKRAATVLNAIAETNVQQNIDQNAEQAALQLRYLNAQLPDLESQLHAAQTKLATFLSGNPTLAALSQSTEYLVTQAATLDQQIGPLQAQTAEAQVGLGSQNPKLALLGAQLSTLKKQRADLMAGIAKLPKDQQTLVRLQSDVTNSGALYTAMLNQAQTLQIAKAGTVGDVVIVDPAIAPSGPVAPNKPLVISGGLTLGLFLGALAAFGRRALNHGIDNPDILDERLGLPVYAVLPHSGVQQRLGRRREAAQPGSAMLLATVEPHDPATESLRSLRTALQLSLPKSGNAIICITSPSPNEGKSFVASNLGFLFAEGGQKVLIIDADLRRGHLHRAFGWQRGLGFADLLTGKAPIEDVIRKTQLDNFDVMTTGTLPDDAASLLMHSDLTGIFNRLGALYDLIIIDVPPVLAVSDAYIIARHTTMNLLLLKHGMHGVNQIRLLMRRFARQGIKLEGSILNDVSAAAQRYAYLGYGYQYQYQYKS